MGQNESVSNEQMSATAAKYGVTVTIRTEPAMSDVFFFSGAKPRLTEAEATEREKTTAEAGIRVAKTYPVEEPTTGGEPHA